MENNLEKTEHLKLKKVENLFSGYVLLYLKICQAACHLVKIENNYDNLKEIQEKFMKM